MAILGHIMVLWPKYSEYRHQNWYISYIIYSLLVQEFIKRLKGVQNLNCQNSENGQNGRNGPKMAQILRFKLLSKKTFILGDLSKVSLNLTKS